MGNLGMIKKIATDKLAVGMYIHDIDASWMSHPFLKNHFAVNNQQTIDEVIAAGIKHVYIDTERGLDYELAVPLEVVQRGINDSRRQVAEQQTGLQNQVGLEAELIHAQTILHDANRAVRSFMQDVRFGKQVENAVIDEVVENISGSVFRNKDALMTLLRIKTADQYTFLHSISVCVLMTAFARAMDYDADTVRQISVGSLLHDLGKMRVPPEILNKPGRLTQAEFEVMKRHVDFGGELLAELDWISDLSMRVVMEHHERIDGTGYPYGLTGEALSEAGRMSAIVDVYDALTSNRCYKKAWEPTYTLGKILEWSRDHFGEAITHQFVRCVGIYPVGTLVRLGSGVIAVVIEQHEDRLLQPRVRVVYDESLGRYVTPEDIDLNESDLLIHEAVAAHKVGIDPLAFF